MIRFAALLLALALAPLASAAALKVPSTAFPTIQSAANAANSGDVIVIAKGVYPESVTLTAKSLVTIRAKKGAVIDNGTTAAGLVLAGSAQIVVRGVTVRRAFGYGFQVEGCGDVTITRCTAQDIGGDGFVVHASGVVRLLKNRCIRAFTGIAVNSNGVILRQNRLTGCITSGISVLGNGLVIDGNSISGVASSHGCNLGDGGVGSAADVLFTKNVIRNVADGLAGDGVRMDGVAGCAVIGNRIGTTSGNGISLLSGTAATIQDNRVQRAGQDGIAIAAKSAQVIRNSIRKSGMTGVSVSLAGDQSLLTGNSIRASGAFGVDLSGDFCQVIENVATGSAQSDLRDLGMSNVLVDNRFDTIAP